MRLGQSSASSRLKPTLGHSAVKESCTGGGSTLSEWISNASTPCGRGPAQRTLLLCSEQNAQGNKGLGKVSCHSLGLILSIVDGHLCGVAAAAAASCFC